MWLPAHQFARGARWLAVYRGEGGIAMIANTARVCRTGAVYLSCVVAAAPSAIPIHTTVVRPFIAE